MKIEIDVIGHGRVIERIEREPIQRVGYKAVNYHGCLFRVIPNGTPRIDTNDPIRCRGEKWPRPVGRELRETCASAKRGYKLSKLGGKRAEAAWQLARARRLRCPWLKEVRKHRA